MKKNGDTNRILQKFNDWIDEGLARHNWSLRELGRQGDVSQAHLSNVRNGKRAVTYDLVASVARAFGEIPETAFREVGLLPPYETSAEQLQDILNHLPKEQRREVIKYAEWKRAQEQEGDPA